jgi:hypothetical protein
MVFTYRLTRGLATTAIGLAALAAASGCGGGSSASGTTTSATTASVDATALTTQTRTHDCLTTAKRNRVLAQLASLTASMHRLALASKAPSDPGPLRLQRATNTFLIHLESSHLAYLTRNRLTDFAASAVEFACHSCFEMLEDDRPIPVLKYGHSGACPA